MNTNSFSFDTIAEFDNHIDLSIPNYSNLQNAILRIATHYLRDAGRIYDLGCSTGALLRRLAELSDEQTELIGLDKSDNLLSIETNERVELRNIDLTSDSLTLESANLILSIFTLQFLPIDKRTGLIQKVYDALPVGGAFIVAEKQYLNDGYLQDTFTFSYYDMKLKHFSAEEILSKQLALRRIMRPLSEGENRELLSKFSRVVSFWQFLSFKAYLCIK